MIIDSRVKELKSQGEYLFQKKSPVLGLWQELAENFYPERADFTATRWIGRDYAANLTTSYPILARRELANAFSQMLRPPGQEWFYIETSRNDRLDIDGRRWLQYATTTQRNAMADRKSSFVRATSEADNDFAAFGQCAISTELNTARDTLRYRCHHLRDLAWCENEDGRIDTIYHRWKPEARALARMFPNTISFKVKELLEKSPYQQVNVMRVILPSDHYQAAKIAAQNKIKTPYVSIYLDTDNDTILEEVGVLNTIYAIPRWETVSGVQYAVSPATVAALPDARLIQAMTLVLLEVGEQAADPPRVTPGDIVRGDYALYSGGVTTYDATYDEKSGEVLRPIAADRSGLGFAMQLRESTQQAIAKAFYLDTLNLPTRTSDMTAYEVSQRVQEYIRNALPLFGPAEMEYNGAICEDTFHLLERGGAFGPRPKSLQDSTIQFRFESPLHQAVDKQKVDQLSEARAMLAQSVALDPSSAFILDANVAVRDALNAARIPAIWMRSEDQVAEMQQTQQQQQQAQQMIQTMQQGGAAAEQIGRAGQAIQGITQGGGPSGSPPLPQSAAAGGQ